MAVGEDGGCTLARERPIEGRDGSSAAVAPDRDVTSAEQKSDASQASPDATLIGTLITPCIVKVTQP